MVLGANVSLALSHKRSFYLKPCPPGRRDLGRSQSITITMIMWSTGSIREALPSVEVSGWSCLYVSAVLAVPVYICSQWVLRIVSEGCKCELIRRPVRPCVCKQLLLHIRKKKCFFDVQVQDEPTPTFFPFLFLFWTSAELWV